jgi:ribonuclease T1
MNTGRPSCRSWQKPWFAKLGAMVGIAAAFAVCSSACARDMTPELAAAREQTNTQYASSIALSALPREAQTTYRLILAGGPFPYDKDGVVFGNREHQLPRHTRGYYREYTVKTPGSRDRGARRIVCGGAQLNRPEACYYTGDHYANFRRIAESQPGTNR